MPLRQSISVCLKKISELTDLGEVLRELARQKESQVLEGHLMGDHVHMFVSIPPKYAVSQVVGYIKRIFGSCVIL